MPAKAGHGIHHQQSPVRPGERREVLDGLVGARAGLGLHDPQHLCPGVRGEGGGDLLAGERLPPGALQGVHDRAAALHHVLHAQPEDAVHRHALHAGHPGSAHGESQRIRGPEYLAQLGADLVHDLEVLGVQMPERGRAEGAQDALGDGTRAGSEQETFVGMHG